MAYFQPMSSPDHLIDWNAFNRAREELGSGFVRILGYFKEDGVKSVVEIEEAIRAKNAAALVRPAHTLKGEARQFGAEPLGDLAELIEMTARSCLEMQTTPDELIPEVVKLRPLFDQTMKLFDRETNPLVQRRAMPAAGFGRRAVFGRAG
jgi:HPt (histidine-containing phosphotransfer) domain-containing protein